MKRKTRKNDKVSIVYCLYPNMKEAKKAAQVLLAENLIVCANIVPQVKSLYIWKDELQQESEVIVYFKTLQSLVGRVKKAVVELHPYEVPFVAEIRPQSVNAAYVGYALDTLRST